MSIEKKQILYTVLGGFVFLALIAFAVLFHYSGIVLLLVWILTLLFYAGLRARNEQLTIINNKLIDEIQKATNAASIAQTHNDMLISIIDTMEKEGKSFKESAANIVQETSKQKEKEND